MRILFFAFCFFVAIGSRAQQNKPAPPISRTVVAGNLVFLSGQIGTDPATGQLAAGGFEAEAKQVMENMGALLKQHDLGYDDLVQVTIYLKSMDHYDAVNKVYAPYFKKRFPARVCIAVLDLPAKASVEIAGIAQKQ